MSAAQRYEPGPAALVDLSDNTNLWGPPPAVAAALARLTAPAVARYPTAYGERLKAAAAAYLGVHDEQVVTGCGSDDVLDAAIRAAAEPGSRLVFSAPTFSMIPVFAAVNRLEPVPVPFRDDWNVDAERLVAAGGAVTFLCTPNNPTGTGISRAAIESVVERASGLVIVDEAYAEYAGTSAADLVSRSERVLVTRTLSKAFGLAGLRVGYGLGAPALVRQIERARGPYKVTVPSEAAAVAALTEGVAWMRDRVAETVDIRARFEAAVAGSTCVRSLPSRANFVLLVERSGQQGVIRRLDEILRARGIAGRLFPALPRLGDGLRLTLGPWELLAPVIESIATVESARCA